MIRRLAVVLVVVLGPALAAAPAGHAAGPEPIVFVHGWNGGPGGFATMIERFTADGYSAGQLHAWQYNTSQDNRKSAEQLAAYVGQVRQQTGAAKVDVISHSMGGLNSRWYLKFLGGTAYVDDWVSLGGPNHGTEYAYGCFWEQSCYNMQPNSRFLKELNGGDETPGTVRYGTWRSPCDEAISPSVSTELAGAQNTVTACIAHGDLLTNQTVYGQVRGFVG